MTRRTWLGLLLLAFVVVPSVTSQWILGRTVAAQTRRSQLREVPKFKVDPAWPKIPNGWIFGWTSSVFVDQQDHVWVLQRPGTLAPEEKVHAAPPVLEFDAAGNFIQGWGGPGAGYEWPNTEHGLYLDYKGFVWLGGSGAKDNQLLKFTKSGKFVLQIGHAGQSKGNADTQNLDQPADTFVYAKTNELFVADGYANKRVIVFDADTGAFKRMWGAFGNVPTDDPPRAARGGGGAPAAAKEPDGPNGPTQFVPPVHAARVSNDDLVYVSDRGGKRVQVFTLAGKYVNQVFIDRDCMAPQCGNGQTAASTAFSPDPEQRYLYVASRSPGRIHVLDRKTLEILDSFGQPGKAPGEFQVLHHMGVDSKGNLYATEVNIGNRRVQKFVFTGMSPIASK